MAKKTTSPCSQSSSTLHPVQLSNIIPVDQLRQQLEQKSLTNIDQKPGVYRWWFPEEEKDRILGLIGDQTIANQLNLLKRKIGNKEYYALYVGESVDLNQRIQDHVKGPFPKSTFRRTLRAILAQGSSACCDSEIVDNCIDTCYWEWDYFSNQKEVEKAELCQKAFAYPLNIKTNHTVPSDWIAILERLINAMK